MILIGDTHGLRSTAMLIAKAAYRNENLVHVGDLGLGFQDIGRDILDLMHLDDMLIECNCTLYAIRGNHDNPIFWDKSKGLNLPKFHKIHLLDDYSVRVIEGKTMLFVGGAISIDRAIRETERPYPTWWKDETFKFDYGTLEEAIKGHDNIDVVVTHTAPNFVHPISDNVGIVNNYHAIERQHGRDLKKALKEERELVTKFHDALINVGKRPQHWFYGHFHSSNHFVKQGTVYKLLNVNETYELL